MIFILFVEEQVTQAVLVRVCIETFVGNMFYDCISHVYVD